VNDTAIRDAFEARFGAAPERAVRAPGRVNLIGEHTDTSDGFVMPMAIDREVRVVLTPRSDTTVRLVAFDLGEETTFDATKPEVKDGWASYLHGVAWALGEEGLALQGFDGVVSGDVPRGAGLSSSAAIELALMRAFFEASGFDWDAKRMAVLARRVENEWVGVASGIMDQLICACGEEGTALTIDCRDLSLEPAPLPAGYTVVILDTGTRRGLVGSEYNQRKAQVDEAARILGADVLRDVTPEQVDAQREALGEAPYRRARHVTRENRRVLEAAAAMREGDAETLGALINASHVSLRDDYEVSGPALDRMVEIAQAQPGCAGARMTGAGFAGCAVALVADPALAEFTSAVKDAYDAVSDVACSVYVVSPQGGASTLA
jgi:galactokinase